MSRNSYKSYIQIAPHENIKTDIHSSEKIEQSTELVIACSVAKIRKILNENPTLQKPVVKTAISVGMVAPGGIPVMVAAGAGYMATKKILTKKGRKKSNKK